MPSRTYYGAGWIYSSCRDSKQPVGRVPRNTAASHVVEGKSDTPDDFSVKVVTTVDSSSHSLYNGTLSFNPGTSSGWKGEIPRASQTFADKVASRISVDQQAPIGQIELITEALEFKGSCPGDVWRKNPGTHPPAILDIKIT